MSIKFSKFLNDPCNSLECWRMSLLSRLPGAEQSFVMLSGDNFRFPIKFKISSTADDSDGSSGAWLVGSSETVVLFSFHLSREPGSDSIYKRILPADLNTFHLQATAVCERVCFESEIDYHRWLRGFEDIMHDTLAVFGKLQPWQFPCRRSCFPPLSSWFSFPHCSVFCWPHTFHCWNWDKVKTANSIIHFHTNLFHLQRNCGCEVTLV